MSQFEDYLKDNLETFIKIREANELGDCEEVAKDCFNALQSFKGELNAKITQIHCGGEYVEDYFSTLLPPFNIIERGGIFSNYVIHFVVSVDDYILDLNYSDKIESVNDFCLNRDEYISKIKSINKDKDIKIFER